MLLRAATGCPSLPGCPRLPLPEPARLPQVATACRKLPQVSTDGPCDPPARAAISILSQAALEETARAVSGAPDATLTSGRGLIDVGTLRCRATAGDARSAGAAVGSSRGLGRNSGA